MGKDAPVAESDDEGARSIVNPEQKKVWEEAVGVELPFHEHTVDKGWWSPSSIYASPTRVNVQDIIYNELLKRFGASLDMRAVERAFDDRHRDTWADRHLLTGGPRNRKPSKAWTAWFEANIDAKNLWSEGMFGNEPGSGDWYFDFDKAMAKIAAPANRRSLLDTAIAAGWLDLEDLVDTHALTLYRARTDPRQTAMAFNKRGSRTKRSSRRAR